jgi:TPR repeat protein
MNNRRRRTMIRARGPVLLMLIVISAGKLGPALAGSNEALANTVAGAFTPAQISELIASAAGKGGSRTDRETQSLDQLRQLLDVSGDVVLALLSILDRRDIQPADLVRELVQSAIQYHAVTDRLTEITSEDPEGERLVTQARAAMTAGQFNDTEALLRQLENREVTFSNRSPNGGDAPGTSAAQHLIRAAQAGTVLGEIALMKLRYGEATGHFQAAQQRLALLSHGEQESAEPPPGKSPSPAAVDTAPAQPTEAPLTAETNPPLAQPDVAGSPAQEGTVQPVPQIDRDHPEPQREQSTATIGSNILAANQAAAMTEAAPRSVPEQPTGSPSADAVLSADMLTLLLRRGDALLALGDVSGARLLYERAAAAGDARGATGAGKTYDPVFLLTIGARGIRADPIAAANWYRRAIELGDQTAVARLTQLSQRSAR